MTKDLFNKHSNLGLHKPEELTTNSTKSHNGPCIDGIQNIAGAARLTSHVEQIFAAVSAELMKKLGDRCRAGCSTPQQEIPVKRS